MTRIRGKPTLEIAVALPENRPYTGAVQIDKRSTARASGPPRPITKTCQCKWLLWRILLCNKLSLLQRVTTTCMNTSNRSVHTSLFLPVSPPIYSIKIFTAAVLLDILFCHELQSHITWQIVNWRWMRIEP